MTTPQPDSPAPTQPRREDRQRVLFQNEHGTRHLWAVTDSIIKVAAHLWVHVNSDGAAYGGVEHHCGFREDWQDAEPGDKHCWLLNGPCWHDGSSLAAERWIRRFNEDGDIENVEAWNYLRGIVEDYRERATAAVANAGGAQ